MKSSSNWREIGRVAKRVTFRVHISIDFQKLFFAGNRGCGRKCWWRLQSPSYYRERAVSIKGAEVVPLALFGVVLSFSVFFCMGWPGWMGGEWWWYLANNQDDEIFKVTNHKENYDLYTTIKLNDSPIRKRLKSSSTPFLEAWVVYKLFIRCIRV